MSITHPSPTVQQVSNFQQLTSTPFQHQTKALCWQWNLSGNFAEIVQQLSSNEHVSAIDEETLLQLSLTEAGNLARTHILSDFKSLQEHGAEPVLNLIRAYPRDAALPFFPKDVYSFHVDRAPAKYFKFRI